MFVGFEATQSSRINVVDENFPHHQWYGGTPRSVTEAAVNNGSWSNDDGTASLFRDSAHTVQIHLNRAINPHKSEGWRAHFKAA